MKKLISYLMLLWALFASGCSDTDPDQPAPMNPDEPATAMFVNVAAVGGSRAGESDIEGISTLRFLVFKSDGSLEFNRCYLLNGASLDNTQFRIPVTVGQKSIWLIANDENVDLTDGRTLHQLISGNPGNLKETLANLEFTPDFSKEIPLTGTAEVNITSDYLTKEGETPTKTLDLYIVRAATKFDVKFINKRHDSVKIESFSVSSLAGSEYLFAHLNDGAGIHYRMTDAGAATKSGFIFNENINEKTGTPLPWIEWLYKASEESQADNNSEKPLADRRGWIMEYSIPSQTPSEKSWEIPADATLPPYETGKEAAACQLPTLYFPESQTDLQLDSEFAPGLEQKYTFKVKFSSSYDNARWTTSPELSETFSNLRALFRNTHVILEITLDHSNEIKWRIYLRAWNCQRTDEIIM